MWARSGNRGDVRRNVRENRDFNPILLWVRLQGDSKVVKK